MSGPRGPLAVVSLAVLVGAFASPSAAQPRTPGGDGLASMVPPEAFFYVERRGHTAIRKVFLASNLGKMATDEVINAFVHGTRVRVGQMIVKGMFQLEEAEDVDRHQKLLHQLLKPFWYRPAAFYAVLDNGFRRSPGMGFLCSTGTYRAECKKALEALMRVGVPDPDQEGTRQEFTYRKHATTWKGVAKGRRPFELPKDPAKLAKALGGKSLFMVCWVNDLLLVATDLSAADAMSRMLSATARPKSKAANASFQTVMKKTSLKDWAFRWYLDTALLVRASKAGKRDPLSTFGLGGADPLSLSKTLGVGGTGGYVNKKYARRTYIHTPGGPAGVLGFLKKGGSYKKALAMVPDTTTFCAAAQFDAKAVRQMLPKLMGIKLDAKTPDDQNSEKVKVWKHVQSLTEASDGHIGAYMTDVQGVMGMMGGGGPPVGAVLGLKDRQKALAAIDGLAEIADAQNPADPDRAPPPPPVYRKITIRRLGPMVRVAVLKDRAVIALSEDTLKTTIDSALDGTGGIVAGSKTEKLAKTLGKAPAFFRVDLAALAKAFWPMVMQMSAQQEQRRDPMFPLAAVPSAAKLSRMLGPEIAVLKPDADGLLLKSRGKIPFATKLIFYPTIMMVMWL